MYSFQYPIPLHQTHLQWYKTRYKFLEFVNWQSSRSALCCRSINGKLRHCTSGSMRRRVYYARRDRTRERSDNDIFQNNSLFQGSPFAYESSRAAGRVESGIISAARSFSGCSPPLAPSLPPCPSPTPPDG